jgi:hypothetical protein
MEMASSCARARARAQRGSTLRQTRRPFVVVLSEDKQQALRTYLHKTRSRHSSRTLGSGHQNRMTIDLYDPTPPHEFPYTHAFSAYSARVPANSPPPISYTRGVT